MKRNKKLFQLYASTLSTENGQLSASSPASPTRSEVSSNDSNTILSQRQTACISPPTLSLSNNNNNTATTIPSPTRSHINPQTNSLPLSNNLSNNIANLLMPYTPTTTIKTTNTTTTTSTTSSNCTFFPRPTHLSKLSPPSPLLGTKLIYSNIIASNFPPNSPTVENHKTKQIVLEKVNVDQHHHDLLYSKLWDHIDSFSLKTNNSIGKVHKQHKTKQQAKRMKISISDLLC